MGGAGPSVAIVGAGVAGCAAAQFLAAAGHRVTLFDKGRIAGGRLAAKRLQTAAGAVEGAIGAQYASADGPEFAARLEALEAAGHAACWHPQGLDLLKPRFVGRPDMRGLIADIPDSVTVRAGTRVDRLARAEDGWWLAGDSVREGPFAALLVTAPAPQTAALLAEPAPQLAAKVAKAQLAPCWAALLWFEARVGTGFDAARPDHPPLAWVAREGARPGARVPGDLWVVQAGPSWSGQHLEIAEETAAARLAAAFAEIAGGGLQPAAMRAHRWRFALVTQPLGAPTLCDPALRLATAGDWHLGPGLEAAWLSGRAAGRAIAQALA